MLLNSYPLEDPHVKGGNATLKLYGVAHFQRMGNLSAARRKQLIGIGERPAMTQDEVTTEVQRLVEIVEGNESQRDTYKEADANT